MKIRSGFVANSSSSSFIIKAHTEIKSVEDVATGIFGRVNDVVGDEYSRDTVYTKEALCDFMFKGLKRYMLDWELIDNVLACPDIVSITGFFFEEDDDETTDDEESTINLVRNFLYTWCNLAKQNIFNGNDPGYWSSDTHGRIEDKFADKVAKHLGYASNKELRSVERAWYDEKTKDGRSALKKPPSYDQMETAAHVILAPHTEEFKKYLMGKIGKFRNSEFVYRIEIGDASDMGATLEHSGYFWGDCVSYDEYLRISNH